jgi:hypothetical protein
MQVSTSPDGNLTLQMAGDEAEAFRKSVRVSIAALVTLYARADMKEAKDFFVKVSKALESRPAT